MKYIFFKQLARDLADLFCRGANMNLLSIETEAEQTRIDELVENFPGKLFKNISIIKKKKNI